MREHLKRARHAQMYSMGQMKRNMMARAEVSIPHKVSQRRALDEMDWIVSRKKRTKYYKPFFDQFYEATFYSAAWSSKHRVLRLCISDDYCDKVRTFTVRGDLVYAVRAALMMDVDDREVLKMVLPQRVAKCS